MVPMAPESTPRPRCTATTARGARCRNGARSGSDRCGKHAPPPMDEGLRLEFLDIAQEIYSELQSMDIPAGSRPAYWTLIVNCVKNAKEEARANDAQHVTYHIVHEDPLLPEGDVLDLPDLPPPSAGD